MNCPVCDYMMTDWDNECPRCARLGPPPAPDPVPATVAPAPPGVPIPLPIVPPPVANRFLNDQASFRLAFLGFSIPPLGLLIWFFTRKNTPRSALSALKGAIWGTVVSIVLTIVVTVTAGILARQYQGNFDEAKGVIDFSEAFHSKNEDKNNDP